MTLSWRIYSFCISKFMRWCDLWKLWRSLISFLYFVETAFSLWTLVVLIVFLQTIPFCSIFSWFLVFKHSIDLLSLCQALAIPNYAPWQYFKRTLNPYSSWTVQSQFPNGKSSRRQESRMEHVICLVISVWVPSSELPQLCSGRSVFDSGCIKFVKFCFTLPGAGIRKSKIYTPSMAPGLSVSCWNS